MSYVPRLKQEYNNKVISNLKEEFGYKNVMQVPKLKKIVISKGVGAAVSDKKLIDYAVEEITNISGQKAVATISKKDVATFKLRKGMPIGVKVTLRGEKMKSRRAAASIQGWATCAAGLSPLWGSIGSRSGSTASTHLTRPMGGREAMWEIFSRILITPLAQVSRSPGITATWRPESTSSLRGPITKTINSRRVARPSLSRASTNRSWALGIR